MKKLIYIIIFLPNIIFGSILIQLTENNNLPAIKQALQQGINVNETDSLGFTALHVASWNGFYDIAKTLLDYGANPNILTRSGSSPLRFAPPSIVPLLKRYGAYETPTDLPVPRVFNSTNVYIQQIIPYTGKVITSRGNNVTKIISNFITNSYFYTNNYYIDHTYPKKSYSIFASKTPKEVSKLYQWNKNGNNQLHRAAAIGNIEKIKELMEDGLDPFLKNNNGDTMLRFAVENKNFGTVQYLVEEVGLDVNSRNNQFTTPIIFATLNNDTNMIAYLAQMGANVNAGAMANVERTVNGETRQSTVSNWTPLMAAAQLGYNDAVKVLLDYEADINATDSDNWTALLFTVQNGYKSTAEFLIRLGIDYNIESVDQHTAQSLAVDNKDQEMIALLTRLGAKPSSIPALKINEQTTTEEIEVIEEVDEYIDEESTV
ncbi:MAG: ankyrin repeat domain-containing protein [Brevinema sp.]